MSEPAAKKQRGDSGQPISTDGKGAAAAAVGSEAAVAASPAAASPAPVPRSLPSMRDELLNLQLLKQGAEGVRHRREGEETDVRRRSSAQTHYHPFCVCSPQRVYTGEWFGRSCIVKERFHKAYRHPVLEARLCLERLRAEVRALAKARRQAPLASACYTPAVYYVDEPQARIYMERIHGDTVKDKMHTLQLDKAEGQHCGQREDPFVYLGSQ
jgi:hypothetical protein